MRGPGGLGVTIIIGGDTGAQHSGHGDVGLGDPTSAPMLGMAPSGLVNAPAGLVSPQITAALAPSSSAVANPPLPPRPYGMPVPGGVLIGADISMQIRVRNACCSPSQSPPTSGVGPAGQMRCVCCEMPSAVSAVDSHAAVHGACMQCNPCMLLCC